jgi:hypothetical protein
MARAYFSKPPWPPFVDGGTTYDLSHLNEFTFDVVDSAKVARKVIVSFSDHCFTRPPQDANDTAPVYPGCSRGDGRFCFERYALSHEIATIIREIGNENVWNSASENYIIGRGTDRNGNQADYVIIFSLEKLAAPRLICTCM